MIDDWLDNGRIDGVYSARCLEDARKRLPEDVRAYSDAEEKIDAKLQESGRSAQGGTGGGSDNGSGDGSSGGGSGGGSNDPAAGDHRAGSQHGPARRGADPGGARRGNDRFDVHPAAADHPRRARLATDGGRRRRAHRAQDSGPALHHRLIRPIGLLIWLVRPEADRSEGEPQI